MKRVHASSVPALTAEQMREVDRVVTEDLHIELAQMMENAGRSLAELAVRLFSPGSATILAGPGGNGGGGLVAARHLANRGVRPSVVLSEGEGMAPVPDHQLDILRRMAVPVLQDPPRGHVIVDAVIGYSLRGNPRGRARELIEWANAERSPVLALDVPSGLDPSTGAAGRPCVTAAATLTLALPKAGLLRAPAYVGRLFLADISVPTTVYRRLGLEVPTPFRDEGVVELAY